MNELAKSKDFLFGELNVRVAGSPEAPLFAAVDVCTVLGLTNSRMVVDALDEDERCKLNLRRQGETWFLTESGLYHLIFKSRKKAAADFRRWVTGEVLPAIRAEGRYVVKTGESPAETEELTLPDWLREVQVDPVEHPWVAARLLEHARGAAVQMGFRLPSQRESDGLERYPRSILNYAVGMLRYEATRPANEGFISYFPPGFVQGTQGMRLANS